MIINKLNNESVNALMNRLKSDFENQKPKYIDQISGGFNLNRDLLKCLEGNITIDVTIELNADESDLDNSKKLYKALNEKMTAEDADDERLWTYLTHFTFFKYTQQRWVRESKSKSIDVIEDRFFYKGIGRVARTRNAVARLWWIPFLTFDKDGDTEEKKWKYTTAAFSSQEVLVSLFERTMGSYRNVRNAFLDYITENRTQSKEIQYLARKINNLGGVYLIPFLTEEKIKDFLKKEHDKYEMDNDS